MSSDWENIPGDLLRSIKDRLMWCADKVRLSCVCKSWKSELDSCSRFQLPLLLLSSSRVGETDKIFDITDNKTYNVVLRQLQEFDPPFFLGSSHRWVITEAYKKGVSHLFMFDPLNGCQKLFEKPFPLYSSKCGRLHITKCVVSSNPNLRDDYMVAVSATGHGYRTLAYTTGNNGDWNEFSIWNLNDIIFYQGRLYGLTDEAQLMLIEIGSSKVIPNLSPKLGVFLNETTLVDSCVGLLMVVRIVYYVGYFFFTTRRFKVYKFDFKEGKWSSNLSEIGGDTLFVGTGLRGAYTYISLKLGHCHAAEVFKPNTIYYFDLDCQDRDFDNLRAFDLKTGKIEELPAFKRKIWQISAWSIPASY